MPAERTEPNADAPTKAITNSDPVGSVPMAPFPGRQALDAIVKAGGTAVETCRALTTKFMNEAVPRIRIAFSGRKLGNLRGLGKLRQLGKLRSWWFLPLVAGGGLLVGIVLVMVTRSLGSSGPTAPPAGEIGAPPAAASTASSSAVPSGAIVPAPSPASESNAPVCSVTAPPRAVAPNALVNAGLEVRSLGEHDVGLGFAAAEHEATAMQVNSASLSTSGTFKVRSKGPIRRVTPFLGPKAELSAAVDADRKNDALRGRRTVPLEPALQVGAGGADVGLVWSRPDAAASGKLWTLDGDGEVEALRGAPPAGSIMPLVFRQGNAVHVGLVDVDQGRLSPRGALTRVDGLGANVGSPSVAISDGVVFAAWAERTAPDAPWRIRFLRFVAGESPGPSAFFSPPPGGKGENAMSPSVTALAHKRFLLVWTEGAASGHGVRASTLSEDGAPLGPLLEISTAGENSGQAQAAVTGGGTGVVAFLESTPGGSFQVMATPIACGAAENK